MTCASGVTSRPDSRIRTLAGSTPVPPRSSKSAGHYGGSGGVHRFALVRRQVCDDGRPIVGRLRRRQVRSHDAVARAQGCHQRSRNIQVVDAPDGVAAFVVAGVHLAQLHVVVHPRQINRSDCPGHAVDREFELGARLYAFQPRDLELFDAQLRRRWRDGNVGHARRDGVAGRAGAASTAKTGVNRSAFLDAVAAPDGVAPHVDAALDFTQGDAGLYTPDANGSPGRGASLRA